MNNQLGSFVAAYKSGCTGCRACELACFAVHNKDNKVGYTIGTVEIPVTPRLYLTRLEEACMPVQCKHCEDAPCLNSCSAKVISKTDGTVTVNEELCIGCKNCMMACPFGAIELLPIAKKGKPVMQLNCDEERKAAFKCDLCSGTEGGPACVKACPHEVLKLIDLAEDRKQKNLKAAMALTLTAGV